MLILRRQGKRAALRLRCTPTRNASQLMLLGRRPKIRTSFERNHFDQLRPARRMRDFYNTAAKLMGPPDARRDARRHQATRTSPEPHPSDHGDLTCAMRRFTR